MSSGTGAGRALNLTHEQLLTLVRAYKQTPHNEGSATEPMAPNGLALFWPALQASLFADSAEFIRESAQVLRNVEPCPGATALLKLLLKTDLFWSCICGPSFSPEGALDVARVLCRHEPHFDVRLAHWLLGIHRTRSEAAARLVCQRGLGILAGISDGNRMVPLLIQLLRLNDPHLRSKTAALLAKVALHRNAVTRLLSNPDPRVRANVVEALWTSGWKGAPDALNSAANDPHHRVRANALVGLYVLGDNLEVVRRLGEMIQDTLPVFRAAAAWAMGMARDPAFAGLLETAAHDPEGMVRRNALRALVAIRKAHPAGSDQGNPAVSELRDSQKLAAPQRCESIA